MAKNNTSKIGIIPKLIAWGITLVSLIWLVESNYDYEPIICSLTGIAGLISIHGFENYNFEFKRKFLNARNRIINSMLTPHKIIKILNSTRYEKFKQLVHKFKFVQFEWQGVGIRGEQKANGFRFTYKVGKSQYFYHLTKQIGYNRESTQTSFYSYNLGLKKKFLRRINLLVDKGVFKLKKEYDGETIESKTYILGNIEDQSVTDENGNKFFIEIEFVFSDYKTRGQYSISFVYITTHEKEKENAQNAPP